MDQTAVWLDRISTVVSILLILTSIIVPIWLGIRHPTSRKTIGFILIVATIATSVLAALLFQDPAISILMIWLVLGVCLVFWGYRTGPR
jgi:uncharacterized membrane protein HdeD (DUF308 family)